jgi:transcriptional regulator with GAF, ATPase, and Fis domain
VNEELIQHFRDVTGLAKLIGQDPAFLAAISRVPALARGTATVLISGETGTGKELIARVVHYLSERAAFPFVALNCGSLPETLLEDELFGHERGAFTDAYQRRPGLITQAEKGTLFLDEVDQLTSKGQVALLRVLQDQSFRPLGASQEHHVDVRFVAATNASLLQLVDARTFRADLYYRLSVLPIDLPPLRDRSGDILLLAEHFLRKHRLSPGPNLTLTPAARSALLYFNWPGNVRELENAIIRGIHLCQGNAIDVADLGLAAGPILEPRQAPAALTSIADTFKARKKIAIAIFEREYLLRLMEEQGGNVTRAALVAGKERRELGKLLKKYQLDPKIFSMSARVPSATDKDSPTAG